MKRLCPTCASRLVVAGYSSAMRLGDDATAPLVQVVTLHCPKCREDVPVIEPAGVRLDAEVAVG